MPWPMTVRQFLDHSLLSSSVLLIFITSKGLELPVPYPDLATLCSDISMASVLIQNKGSLITAVDISFYTRKNKASELHSAETQESC